nr:MAG TPA: hypothetical protein [Caudoviricetes sp.]
MEVRKGDYMSSRLFSDVKKFVKYIQQRSYLLHNIGSKKRRLYEQQVI